jgi:hypothetical protein
MYNLHMLRPHARRGMKPVPHHCPVHKQYLSIPVQAIPESTNFIAAALAATLELLSINQPGS